MPNIKSNPKMNASKARQANAAQKEAAGILRKQYEEKEKARQPEPKGPVQYATDKTETGGRRAALLAADGTRCAARQVKQRREHRERGQAPTSTEPRKESAPAARTQEAAHYPAEPRHDAALQPKQRPAEQAHQSQTPEPRPQRLTPKTRQSIKTQERTDTPRVDRPAPTSSRITAQAAPERRHITSVRENADREPLALRQISPKMRESIEAKKQVEASPSMSKVAQEHQRQTAVRKTVQEQREAHREVDAQVSRVNGAVRAEQSAIVGSERYPMVQKPRSQSAKLPSQSPSSRAKAPKKAAGQVKVGGHAPTKPTFAPKERRVMERTARTPATTTRQAMRAGEQKLWQDAVKKNAETAKQATKRTVQATKRVAQAAVKAVKAAVSCVAVLGGGAVLLVVLVVVALIAAIVASPFGIFFSNESASRDTVPISAAVAQVNYDFNTRLEELQSADTYDDITVNGSMADWVEILAVFAAKVAGSDGADATDVATIDADRIDRLKTVFWDMNAITSEVETIDHPDSDPDDDTDDSWTEKILHITVTPKAAADMPTAYGFTTRQTDAMNELLAERAALMELVGNLTAVSADAAELMKRLPADLSPERREVVRVACSLVGKVTYFWGGKSLVIGWDSRWGQLQKVWADGSSTTGTYRPYGLDCSGFVDWVFYNATDGAYYPGHGGGATMQHTYCTAISWEDALPGDLVFYPGDEHVGIVGGRDESGNLLIIHCASSHNCVVITGASGFATIGRPLYYTE